MFYYDIVYVRDYINCRVIFRVQSLMNVCLFLVILKKKSILLILAHDCRQESMKDLRDKREWEAWVLAKGLAETRKSASGLHIKKDEKNSDGIKK